MLKPHSCELLLLISLDFLFAVPNKNDINYFCLSHFVTYFNLLCTYESTALGEFNAHFYEASQLTLKSPFNRRLRSKTNSSLDTIEVDIILWFHITVQ